MHTVSHSGWQAGRMDIVVIIGSDEIEKFTPTHMQTHTSSLQTSLSLELDSLWVPA